MPTAQPISHPLFDLLQPYGWLHAIGRSAYLGHGTLDLTLSCELPSGDAASVRKYLLGRAAEVLDVVERAGYGIYDCSVDLSHPPIMGKMRIEVTSVVL